MDFSILPKVELHVHLDCSLSYQVVQLLNPGIRPEQYRAEFVAPAKCAGLADYITRAAKGIELMQTETALQLVTLDLFSQLQADHVAYAEIRFAPFEHLQGGLSPEAVVQAVCAALAEGFRQTGIPAGLLLCTLRHYDAARSMATVRLADQFRSSGVVGFDIASDEAGYPVDAHIAAFDYAFTRGIPCTAHAGEARGADSVWETLRYFHPRRIGHGVRSMEDSALLDFLKQHHIHLEVCPTSNIQTNVYGAISDHPVDRLFRAGLSIGINTDGRTISNTTLATEYRQLQDVFQWEKAQLLQCNRNAIEAAFAPDELKAALRERLAAAWG
ncbi:MAG: adenosine deaminase [Saprospirales bacterium]|nr:adenosine deaminase [Saprospirales bacterium]MBK8921717.1 adenosine deaminase [Saprospirales bacterium]